MKPTQINRQDFLHSLESIQAGLSPKPTVMQSDCFVFGKGEVCSFNGEICCKMKNPLPNGFTAAVHADPLVKLLRGMLEEEITVEESEQRLVVRGQGRKSGIRLEKDILLPTDKVDAPGKWKPLHEDFTEATRLVAACCGKDDSKWVLTHVHVTPDHMEASDHLHHICRYRIKTGVKNNILIKASAIKQTVNLEMTEFSETDSWIHFRNSTGLVFSTMRVVDNFPDISVFLDVKGSKVLLPKGLDEAAGVASIFSELGENEEHEIQVDIHPQKGIRIRGDGASGFYQEIKQTKYRGEPITFLIKPEILAELCKRHQEAVVNGKHLMADTGKFRYVSCLRKAK